MKKKVAIFANGWNGENLYQFMQGLQKGTPDGTADYYVFLCHATYTTSNDIKKSMSSIYELPDLSLFDAVIIYNPGLNFQESIRLIVDRARKSGKPVISIGTKYEGFYFVGIDNYQGMKQLCMHLMEEHGVKKVHYIAGSKENEDSNERLKAIRDTFREHGIPIRDDQVCYSDWELHRAYEYVDHLCKSKDELPDAILCANDFLAESVCYSLADNGIRTPEDVIVSGFDYTEEGSLFYPSISSVNQHYDEMGKLSAGMIAKVLTGENLPDSNLVLCELRPGESCGCRNCNNEEKRRKMYARMVPRKNVDDGHLDGRISQLTTTIIKADTYHDLKERLKREFSMQTGSEGDTFFCMLDPNLARIADCDIADFPPFSYAEKMDVVVSKVKGQDLESRQIQTKELLPMLPDMPDNHIFTLLPIYIETFVCGYMVFVDKIDWFLSKLYYRFEQTFSTSIALYRRNMQVTELNNKLSEIMEKDPLTNVKNRIAYERYLAALQVASENGKLNDFAVVFFDVNNLKLINDSLGHEYGDIYLKNCSDFISGSFPGSPIFRIGGDEFVAIIMDENFQKKDRILENISLAMERFDKEKKTDKDFAEHISIAYGMAVYDHKTKKDIKSICQQADENMYQNKMRMKHGNVR